MKMIFIWKYWKFYVDFENAINISEYVDSFKHNCVSSEAVNFCQLWQERMLAALNMLKSDPKISDGTRTNHKQLNFFEINIKLA